MATRKKLKFEEALKRLEEIVSRLEDGEISLDESLVLFQEGRKLSRECAEQLAEVETRARILLEEEDGSVTDRPFDMDGNEDEEDEDSEEEGTEY